MKTSLITSLFLALSILANAKVPVLFNAHPVYKLVDVTLTDSATVLTLEVKPNGDTKALINKPFIKNHEMPNDKPAQAFKHGYIDGDKKTPLTLNSRVKPADKVVMFFEPLPSDTKTFFYVEKDDDRFQRRTIVGIRLDGQSYHASNLPPAPPVVKREHLLPYKAQVDTATLSFDLMMPAVDVSFIGIHNPWDDDVTGIKFSIDSMSNIKSSYVNMLPHNQRFWVNNYQWDCMMVPGSNTRIIFDAPGYAEALENGASDDEAYDQALHIYEAPLPEIYSTRKYVDSRWRSDGKFDSLPFDAYADSLRAQLQRSKLSIAEIPDLSGAEREFLQLYVENIYISEYSDFLSRKKSLSDVTEDDMTQFKAQFTLVDPTAGELLFASSPAAIYLVKHDSHDIQRKAVSDYLIANGLNDAPVIRDINAYVNAAHSIENIPVQINGFCETPDCDPDKILESIVAQHRGKTLLVDFWATWCGPCMKGMAGLEPLKDDLMARGVDFVYITSESPSLKLWQKLAAQHRGFHYTIPMATQEAMNIPEYKGSIPFYLIYRPDGSLATTIEGWHGVERMLEAIEAAQQPQNDTLKAQ